MRVSTCYLSLLLCALPVLSAEYRIFGRPVLGHGIPSCIKGVGFPGERVKTTPVCRGHETVVHVDAHINHERSVYGPAYVQHGFHKYYIGRSRDSDHLVWVEDPYQWEFAPDHGGKFHNVHVRGRHDYWAEGRHAEVELSSEKEPWFFERLDE